MVKIDRLLGRVSPGKNAPVVAATDAGCLMLLDTAMKANETSRQEPDVRTDIEITVCENGADIVNAYRPESDHAHSVSVGESSDVLRCSCKGHHFRGECSHVDAIESRPLVVSSALAAASTTQASRPTAASSCSTSPTTSRRATTVGYRSPTLTNSRPDTSNTLPTAKRCGACSDLRHDRYRGDRQISDVLVADGGHVETESADETDDGTVVCVEESDGLTVHVDPESELGEWLSWIACHRGESPDDLLAGAGVVLILPVPRRGEMNVNELM